MVSLIRPDRGGSAGAHLTLAEIENAGATALTGELGEGAAESFFDDAIDAATHEHRAAFHVDGANRKSKQHDAQNKPGRAFADRLFSDAAGIEGGRTEVVENYGGGSPVGDEGEHHRGRNHNANPVVAWRCV